ncbi:hypothetical protein FUSO5_03710 [Fusobacterium necrophorum BFTR-1]|uniref:hypothetical protein n=1 Tax=Fusobacterium necrophorum TaxID=859 RepID=UPI000460BA70|nr:hypothetical protein [Fusobacterium necrophorum]KDE65965.1 hypothetical protein FUSO5_03710 [Fusobacterium necrophorum BFTR-1]
MNNERKKYTEVWGDTVVLKELVYSSIIGILLTMFMFYIGKYIFSRIEYLEPSLANGYALLIGVIGCILSGIISAKLFYPKRKVEEKFEFESVENILETAGITVEEEREALSNLDSEIIKELEELELYALLSIIPEHSKNYKKEYSDKMEKGGV